MANRVSILGDVICENSLIEWPGTTAIHAKLPATSLQRTAGGAG